MTRLVSAESAEEIDSLRSASNSSGRRQFHGFAPILVHLLLLALVIPVALAAYLDFAAANSIPLSSDEMTISVAMNDSFAAARIVERLPAKLMFEDRMGTAWISEEPIVADELAVRDPVVEYQAGDVVWSPERRELVIFRFDGSGVADTVLLRLGSVQGGLDKLQNCVRECVVTASFEPALIGTGGRG